MHLIFDKICAGESTADVARFLNQNGFLTPMQYKRKAGCKWLPWPCISEDNFWTANRITRMIRDQRYIGDNVYGKRRRDVVGSWHTIKISSDDWIITEAVHEAIISREQFSTANKMLREFRERDGHPINNKRKVICGCCGHAMRQNNKKIRSYYCDTPRHTDKYECGNELFPAADVIEAVSATIQMYAKLAFDLDRMIAQQRDMNRENRKTLQRRLMVLQSQTEQTERQLLEMYETFVDGTISKAEYVTRKQSLSEQLSKQYDEIDAITTKMDCHDSERESDILKKFKSYALLDELTEENIQELLDQVTIYPDGRMDVKLRFADELTELADSIYSQIRFA